MPKKAISKKMSIAIIFLAIIVIATAAIVYAAQISSNKTEEVKVGVHIGDTFTYKLTGSSVLFSADAVTPDYLSIYNDTDYYTLTITGISGTQVSLNTIWKLINGTQFASSQSIDIANGNTTDKNGFWALYPSNLNVNDLLSPKGFDQLTVNATDNKSYANSTRATNFWQIDHEFTDQNDPTGNTRRDEYDGVYFDRQTGMLVTLTNRQSYSNPIYNIIITWELTSSNVWAVQ